MIINCPECNSEISDKATNCPKCGFPIESDNIEENNEKESLFSILSLIFFVLFIISGFFVAIIPCALFYITSKTFAFIAYGKDAGTKCADIVYNFNRIVLIAIAVIILINIF